MITSHARLGDSGRAAGYTVSEAADAWRVFAAAGWQTDVTTVRGGRPPEDEFGDPSRPGHAAWAADPVVQAKLDSAPAVHDTDPAGYDVVYFVGGHGTMWDFPGTAQLSRPAAHVYERGGVVASVCHGASALSSLRLSDGSLLVANRRIAAFTDSEERAIGLDGAPAAHLDHGPARRMAPARAQRRPHADRDRTGHQRRAPRRHPSPDHPGPARSQHRPTTSGTAGSRGLRPGLFLPLPHPAGPRRELHGPRPLAGGHAEQRLGHRADSHRTTSPGGAVGLTRLLAIVEAQALFLHLGRAHPRLLLKAIGNPRRDAADARQQEEAKVRQAQVRRAAREQEATRAAEREACRPVCAGC